MADPISALGALPTTDAGAFVDRLFRQADVSHDGHVSREEFSAFLSNALASAAASSGSAPGTPGGTPTIIAPASASGDSHGGSH